MGLFGSSDPTKKEEKLLNKGASSTNSATTVKCGVSGQPADSSTIEAKSEEKHLKQALKDVEHAESAEDKGLKKEHHAQGVSLPGLLRWQSSPVYTMPDAVIRPTRRPPAPRQRLNTFSKRLSMVSASFPSICRYNY